MILFTNADDVSYDPQEWKAAKQHALDQTFPASASAPRQVQPWGLPEFDQFTSSSGYTLGRFDLTPLPQALLKQTGCIERLYQVSTINPQA